MGVTKRNIGASSNSYAVSRIVDTNFNNSIIHFTETHRKTSNFDLCLLNFISTCHSCFIRKIIYHLKRNWPRFSLPKFCRSSIYVITIAKFSNSPMQNVFNFPQWTSMDCCKVNNNLSTNLPNMLNEFTKYLIRWAFLVNTEQQRMKYKMPWETQTRHKISLNKQNVNGYRL